MRRTHGDGLDMHIARLGGVGKLDWSVACNGSTLRTGELVQN
jgi:hypothetical protein